MKPELSLADINALPVVMDVVTAGKVLGLGRTKSYELAKTGRFPCRLIRVGKSYLVPTAELLALLGLSSAGVSQPDEEPGTGQTPVTGQ